MRGSLLINGNLGGALIERTAPFVLGSGRGRAPNVLLVTAAWGAGEFGEGGVRTALNEAGVPSRIVDGHDHQIVNLCAWHSLRDFLARRPDVARVWHEVEEAEEALRAFYLEKTTFHADLVRRGIGVAASRVSGFELGRIHARDPLRPEAIHTARELLQYALGREIDASIQALVDNDQRMLEALTQADQQILARTGIQLDPEWRALRQRMEERILRADAIYLFGGSPDQLLAPFRFFDLRPAVLETLRRGALVIGSSAGTLALCERMIVYDQRNADPSRRDFRLLDRGLGIVGGLQALPHCMDRIHTDDPNNLAFLARRFSAHACVGLNEESFLHIDLAGPTATSVGSHDGVYVFGQDGVKVRYDRGERIPLA